MTVESKSRIHVVQSQMSGCVQLCDIQSTRPFSTFLMPFCPERLNSGLVFKWSNQPEDFLPFEYWNSIQMVVTVVRNLNGSVYQNSYSGPESPFSLSITYFEFDSTQPYFMAYSLESLPQPFSN